jgi:hypothetical protein
MSKAYKIVGNKKIGYAVVMQNGVIEYDLLESRTEAKEIRDALNAGIGPEWDAVSDYLNNKAETPQVPR